MMKFILYVVLLLSGILPCSMFAQTEPGMCVKLPMSADGIVRLSKIEVYPEYLEEYVEYAVEVGEVSLRTEPGVLDHVCCRRKGESLPDNHTRNVCKQRGL